ncbi:hypothetical protein [Candidatus Methylacidithermus pantelleriae]|uniref:Uncharacterized protein n=1 Tax=Candidatus Methylacidithermus pantelleriae TaxID=2744239 RepID=A0A8J2FMT6_9BACT|nr:hypothetical protein [Candidatus Methylacidithermus pantelleriae]CAF0689777.1 conserved hypothetical protein [Candidatus Methylacidithermus pantelleriae]
MMVRKVALCIFLGVALGFLAGFVDGQKRPASKGLPLETPELLWISHEFPLQPGQREKIVAIHRKYCAGCQTRCQRICLLHRRIREAMEQPVLEKDKLEALLDEEAKLRRECCGEMLSYFAAVGQELGPEHGRRYLAWVLPRTLAGLGPGGGRVKEPTQTR